MDTRVVRRLIATLFASQSLASLGLTAALTVATIAAKHLSGSAALAGLPTTLFLLGSAGSAYPAGRFMDRFGRRNGLSLGFGLSLVGGAIAAIGLILRNFNLHLIGYLFLGMGRGATDLGRFAAAEIVPPNSRASAVSWVVLGGTVGGISGPLLIGPTGRFAASLNLDNLVGPFFAAVVLFAIGSLITFLLLRPDPRDLGRTLMADFQPAERDAPTRPPRTFGQIMQLRHAQVALAAMMLGQFVMAAIMVITPLHMTDGHHSLDAVAWVIAAHVFGMYGLSILSGRMADSFGRGTAIAAGAVILVAASLLAPLAQNVFVLALALFLLGLGWNFCYVSGSSLLSDVLQPSERGRIQGSNDLLVGLTSAAGSLGSGVIFAAAGFATIGVIGIALALGLLAFASSIGRARLAEAASAN